MVIRQEQASNCSVALQLRDMVPNVEVVYAEELTEGAACTCLLARDLIDNSRPLLIVNSDQYIDWNEALDSAAFWRQMEDEGAEGIGGNILCFKQPRELGDDKWSYAAADHEGFVKEVREKEVSCPCSPIAPLAFPARARRCSRLRRISPPDSALGAPCDGGDRARKKKDSVPPMSATCKTLLLSVSKIRVGDFAPFLLDRRARAPLGGGRRRAALWADSGCRTDTSLCRLVFVALRRLRVVQAHALSAD